MASLNMLSDAELIAFLNKGDEAAFAEIYKRYWKRLLHFAAQKTNDFMEAEHIVQDIFVSLWRRQGTLQVTTLENYLVVSVKYRVIKLFAKQRHERLLESDETFADLVDNSTEDYLRFDELRGKLEQLIGELPERAALIYKLHKEDGLSHQAIADQLDMTERAVNASLVRSKKTLRTAFLSYLNNFLL